jgi:hypothetical protein
MTTYGGVEVQLHTFFNLGTRWRWVVSGRFTSRIRDPGTHRIGGYLYSKTRLDVLSKGKIIPAPVRNKTPVIQPVA